MSVEIANIKREIDRLEQRFYYDYYDCFCPDEMRNTHEVGCKYGHARTQLAELRAKLDAGD